MYQRRPPDICFSAPSGQRMSQRAAPGNYPARCIYPSLSIRLHADHRACEQMGRSREPPVFARFGRSSDETKVARSGNIRAKAARLQALGKRIQLLATTFEDEDEYEAPCGQTTPSLFPAGFFSNAR
jgi:hypothetical protein